MRGDPGQQEPPQEVRIAPGPQPGRTHVPAHAKQKALRVGVAVRLAKAIAARRRLGRVQTIDLLTVLTQAA